MPRPSTAPTDEVINSLPTVIARPLHLLREARRTADINIAAKMLTDYTLRFIGFVCLSQYLKDQEWIDPRLNKLLEEELVRPTQGAWLDAIKSVLDSAKTNKRTLFLQELSDTWKRCEKNKTVERVRITRKARGEKQSKTKLLGYFEWLVNHRNDLEHQRLSAMDPVEAGLFREVAFDALYEYRWLAKYEVQHINLGGLWRCRGLRPVQSPATEYLGRGKTRIIRPTLGSARSSDELILSPLTISRDALQKQHGDNEEFSEIILYAQKDDRAFHYSGPMLTGTGDDVCDEPIALDSEIVENEFNAAVQSKEFPKIGYEQLTADEIKTRVKSVSDVTFQSLKAENRYDPKLHVPRNQYENRLSEWITSPIPLLGIIGDAGAGKTGVLASAVDSWSKITNRPSHPVLFLIGREIEGSANIDRIVEERLRLTGSTVDKLAGPSQLGGLIIVIDGINEHPSRDELLFSIIAQARRTRENGFGARFLLSWRSDEPQWAETMRESLRETNLWWNPATKPLIQSTSSYNNAIQIKRVGQQSDHALSPKTKENESQMESSTSATSEVESSGTIESSAIDSSEIDHEQSDPFRSEANPPVMVIERLNDQECQAIWQRYCDSGEGHSPRFEYSDLLVRSVWLHREICSPLSVRIALQTFDDQECPNRMQAESLFFLYLERLESDKRGANQSIKKLLHLLGNLVIKHKSRRIQFSAIADQGERELIYGNPESAMDILERAGVVTVIRTADNLINSYCEFTDDRVAEHVIGRILAQEVEAKVPVGLANRAKGLYDLVLMQGSVAAAIDLIVGRENIQYLFDFVDEVPPELASIAGRALGAFLLRAGELEAPSIARGLFEKQTESDIAVAEKAVKYLRAEEDSGAAIEYAFLHEIREEIATRATSSNDHSPDACALATAYAECLTTRMEHSESSESVGGVLDSGVDWLRALVESKDPVHEDSLSELQFQLGSQLYRQKDYRGSIPHLERAWQSARKKRWLRFLEAAEMHGAALEESDQRGAAVQALEQLLVRARSRPTDVPWTEVSTRVRIARLLEGMGLWAKALSHRQSTLGLESSGGDRRAIAIGHERVALCLEKLGRCTESIKHFQTAISVATEPNWCDNWSPIPSYSGISRVLEGERQFDEAEAHVERILTLIDRRISSNSSGDDQQALSWIHEIRGDILREADRHEEAIAEYRKSIEIGNQVEGFDDLSLRSDLQRSLVALGRFDEALAAMDTFPLNQESESDPQRIAVYFRCRGDILSRAGRYEKAITEYRKSVQAGMSLHRQTDWTPWSALNGIQKSHVALGRFDEALVTMDEYICFVKEKADRRSVAFGQEIRGDILREAGRHEEAIAEYKRAIERYQTVHVDTVHGEPYLWCAVCEAQIGLHTDSQSTIDRLAADSLKFCGPSESVLALARMAAAVLGFSVELKGLANYSAKKSFEMFNLEAKGTLSKIDSAVLGASVLTITYPLLANASSSSAASQHMMQLIKALDIVQRAFATKPEDSSARLAPPSRERIAEAWDLAAQLHRMNGSNAAGDEATRTATWWRASSPIRID